MIDILSIIPGRKRVATGGWHSFNAICCHHRGHCPDTRSRAGIIISEPGQWAYSCFNCGFKCGITPGKLFSKNTCQLLAWVGIDKHQIDRWSFANYGRREDSAILFNKPVIVNFDKKTLPENCQALDPKDPTHSSQLSYLESRGLSPSSYTYYVTPDATRERDRNRIIIPYYYHGEVVGHTSRFYNTLGPKYISEQQQGYVFNIDGQHKKANVAILVEGQFDAISIGGCAYLGSTICDKQAIVLSKLYKEIIVVPDRDKTGMSICDRALELGYRISIPDWNTDVKDVNDAVKKYGRLPTIISILEASTSSKITVEMKRKGFR